MWFLFGLVTLSLVVLGSFWLRRASGWIGESVTIVDPRGQTRQYQWLESKSKGKPTGYCIGVDTVQGYQFRLIEEGLLHRRAKEFGIGVEQSVGDSIFDQTFFIDSDDQRVGLALRRSPEVRRALLELRQQVQQQGRFTRIQAFRGRLWIEVASTDGIPDPSVRHGIASTLILLDEALRQQDVGGTRMRDPFLFRAMLFLSLSTGLAIFGLLSLTRLSAARLDLDSGYLWWLSLVVGSVLAFALAFAALKVLQQSSRAYRVLVELLTIGLAGAILSSHGLIFEFNRDFDSGVPTLYRGLQAKVQSHTYRCGKNGRNTCTRHTLHLDGERPSELAELRIASDMAARLRSASEVRVEIKPGALGGRWIRAIVPEARVEAASSN